MVFRNERRALPGRRSAVRVLPGRARGLAASAVAFLVALALAAGASAAGFATGSGAGAGAASGSTGGSVLGLKVESLPAPDPDDDPGYQGNGSQLSILLASAANEDVVVTFWTQGMLYRQYSVPFGSLATAPATAPAWVEPDPDDPGAPHAFDRWCTDEEGTVAYDFATPVTRPLDLYASWNVGEAVEVVLHALGGTLKDGSGVDVGELAIERYPGQTYRALPNPVREGYAFGGWWTADGSADGAWDEEVQASDVVPEAGSHLFAKWSPVTYSIRYVNNTDLAGGGTSYDASVTYGPAPAGEAKRFWNWGDALAHGFSPVSGKRFDGWTTEPDGTGTWYGGGAAIEDDLATVPGAYVPLYAKWAAVSEEGPFEVRFMANDGTGQGGVGSVYREFVGDDRIAKGGYIAPFEPPKRTGYQFSCWREGALGESGELVLGRAWGFDEQVMSNLTLYAQWTLRLDVTLPVEVGFAVDADSRAVTTPEADLYAIKSRTVAPVQVEEMAVVSSEDELEEFFNLGDGASGDDAWKSALQDTALWVWRTGPGGASAWTTDFSQEPDGAGGLSFALPLANAAGDKGEYVRVNPDGTPGDTIAGWRNAKVLADNDAFHLEKFDYGNTAFDEGWQGGDPSVRLPLKLGMGISGDLEVETALDGPKPLTHLIVTVSAQG